uniref:Uncharacterized protein n=1 Tax=uncultured delta proteobacterium HF4000_08N17 TaxID=710836 RepID=E0XVG5_9DELT|nr:hypothetical protein [uncultured delta proteobacterium HF4000_08N17]
MKCNSYKICKFISINLYQITQSIFNEVREGYMKDITLEDVKSILRDMKWTPSQGQFLS